LHACTEGLLAQQSLPLGQRLLCKQSFCASVQANHLIR
jgi:hypothetical protein